MSARTPSEPKRWIEVTQWLDKAAADMQATEVLLHASPPLVDPAAFHCQQAAEKIAKAMLINGGHEPPHVHDIMRLGRLVRDDFPDIAEIMEALNVLTGWYVAARYPGVALEFIPTAYDVRSMLVRLQDLLKRARMLVPKAP